MTGELDVDRDISAEVSSFNGKIDEKYELDMGAHRNLPKGGGGGDCNGVLRREEEEAIDNSVENGNRNGEINADGAYVFVNGSDCIGEDGNDSICTDLREEHIEDQPREIDVAELKADDPKGNCDVEEVAVKGESGNGDGNLVNGENGHCSNDRHILAKGVEVAESKGNNEHINGNDEEIVVEETEIGADDRKGMDGNSDCQFQGEISSNGVAVEDPQERSLESKPSGSDSAEEQNVDVDIMESSQSKHTEREFCVEEQVTAECALEGVEEFSASHDIITAAPESEKTLEVLQADQVDLPSESLGSKQSLGGLAEEQNEEVDIVELSQSKQPEEEFQVEEQAVVEPSSMAAEEFSAPQVIIAAAPESEKTFEVLQADEVDLPSESFESRQSVSGLAEKQNDEVDIVELSQSKQPEEEFRIEEQAVVESSSKAAEESSGPHDLIPAAPECERTSEMQHAEQVDSSGLPEKDQDSDLTAVPSDSALYRVIEGHNNDDGRVMEDRKSNLDVDVQQNHDSGVTSTHAIDVEKEKTLTQISDDCSLDGNPKEVTGQIDPAGSSGFPSSADSRDDLLIATAPDLIVSETSVGTDTIEEVDEEAYPSGNPEIFPSSATCGNQPVETELEELNSKENEPVVTQSPDASSEVEGNGSATTDVVSSNISPVAEICFGSIDQKVISSIPINDVNAESNISTCTAETESCSAQDSEVVHMNEQDIVLNEQAEDQSATGKDDEKSTIAIAKGVDVVPQSDAVHADVSNVLASECQNISNEVEKKLFNVLVKMPRYDDENSKEQVNLVQSLVNEKTQIRDAIQAEIQIRKAACKELSDEIEVALSEENAVRELLKSKREEMDSVQSVINRVKNAISVGDIDTRIHNMEQRIQHETLPLKEEKQLIRDIKQLKQLREQLTTNIGGEDELKQALDQREQTEERLKSLRKEADLLRENVLKAEAITKVAKKKYSDEREKLRELQGRFREADRVRQDAYIHLKTSRKQLYEKNKYFWKYKDDVKASIVLASKGDREALSQFCNNQVETFFEIWNKSVEFREEYLRCNAFRTIRRLGTSDGRSLGPDEVMPTISGPINEMAVKDKAVSALPSSEPEKVAVSVEAKPPENKLLVTDMEQKKRNAKTKAPVKPAIQRDDVVTVLSREPNDVEVEEPGRTKEEEELAKKAEELRKAEEAAKLMEQRRLEEKAKAKEAIERKKRNTERAQARAMVKAQKEAEQKEREREKKAKKKERKKAACTIPMSSDAGIEGELAPSSEPVAEVPVELDIREKPATAGKRSQKPSHFVKQNKVTPIPPPLRNRGKRKLHQWMWVLFSVLLIFALFVVGSSSWSLF